MLLHAPPQIYALSTWCRDLEMVLAPEAGMSGPDPLNLAGCGPPVVRSPGLRRQLFSFGIQSTSLEPLNSCRLGKAGFRGCWYRVEGLQCVAPVPAQRLAVNGCLFVFSHPRNSFGVLLVSLQNHQSRALPPDLPQKFPRGNAAETPGRMACLRPNPLSCEALSLMETVSPERPSWNCKMGTLQKRNPTQFFRRGWMGLTLLPAPCFAWS